VQGFSWICLCERLLRLFQGAYQSIDEGARLITYQVRLGSNKAFLIEDKCTMAGATCLISIRNRTAHIIGVNDLAARIREQRKGDLAAVGEELNFLRGIITDGHDLSASGFNFLEVLLDLNQLELTIRAPISGAEKNYRDRTFLEKRIQREIIAILVFECKGRRTFSDDRLTR
jgi:hypothetical protein